VQHSQSLLFADGEKLLLKWPDHGQYFLLGGYYVSQFSITSPPTIDIAGYGDSFRREVIVGPPTVDIHIESRGSFQSIDIDKAEQFFRSAYSMSVNELLALAYQKLNNRES
jgi:hypothetical protein